jgi:hypothetical protein
VQKASQLKWDRKKKRFTSGDQVGADNKKLIRSESGALLPASYNSGRYKEWKQAHRKAANASGSSVDKATPDNGILPARSIYRNRKEKEKVCPTDTSRRLRFRNCKRLPGQRDVLSAESLQLRNVACKILLNIRKIYHIADVLQFTPCPHLSPSAVGSMG